MRTLARGKKTSPEMIYQIMTSWAITQNVLDTSRALGVPATTVTDIVARYKDEPEFAKLREEKRADFSAKASRIIDKALNRLEKDIDDEFKNIPVNHLTTVVGVLTEKKLLAEGKPTDNVEVSIKLPEGIDDYAG